MKKKSQLRELIKSFLIALVIVFLAKALLFFPTKVEGASMDPTLQEDDKIIVSKLIGYTHNLQRGTVIMFKTDDYYVKRVIGLPGDKIEMKNDQLYVNKQLQKETYLSVHEQEAHRLMMKLTEDFGPVEVPENKIFVMGDNRSVSRDSRNGLGFVEKKDVLGTVKAVYHPFNKIKVVR
ncbi:signal peptidase I [Microbacteriaceae bacterium 4G12]